MFNQIKNIFFDFDGVILDSVDCKTLAFESMYSKYGKYISDKVRKYHLKHKKEDYLINSLAQVGISPPFPSENKEDPYLERRKKWKHFM